MWMAEAPSLSVVLPYRNARPWLAQTLVSLAAERDLSFELVAINDGSSDGSEQLLNQLTRDWPPQSMQSLHGLGLGVSAARNLGINAARAEVVAFLDADDRCLPGRLRQPWELLQRQPELSHVHGGWQRIDGRGQFICAVEPWQEGAAFNWNAALQHKAVLPSAWTIRRTALLELGGFDESLSHAEDVDLLVRLEGRWVTPPLASGCLPGVMRARALAQGWLREKSLDPESLERWQGALLLNSLGCRSLRSCEGLALPVLEPGRAEVLWRSLL